MTRPRFVKDPVCPKCLHSPRIRRRGVDHAGEFLEYTCDGCGYEWETQCADAQITGTELCEECMRFGVCPGSKEKEKWGLPCREFVPSKPLPCPFCGGVPVTNKLLTGGVVVRCLNCSTAGHRYVSTDHSVDLEQALERWNRRAT